MNVKDMTTGNPFKHILSFSIPLFLGLVFQQFYAVVDTVIVGRVLGQSALAAVGCTGSINFCVIGFCMGICSGFSIPVAQRFGAKDFTGMRRYVANIIWACICFAILITAVVAKNTDNILTVMKTPADIYDMAYTYILVIFLGIPATILYNVLAGIIRSLGDSKTPLYFLIFSSFLNIGLDLYFMVSLHMGVRGASMATVVSQGISGILCLIYMIKKFEVLHIKKDEWAYDFHIVMMLCYVGIPMGLQYSVTAIGSLILQSSVNSLGSEIVAAVATAGKISVFCITAYDALGSAMATYAGQNVGAGKLERITDGIKFCMLFSAVYSVIIYIVIYFFAAPAVGLFVSVPSANLVTNARTFLLITAAFYITLAVVNVFRFTIQGMGFSNLALFAGVAEMIGRTLVAIALVPVWGIRGAGFASPLAWILADCFLIPAYFYVSNKLKKTLEASNT